MENTDPQHQHGEHTPPPVEHDYSKHENNPGPSKEAVEERNSNGAGSILKWIIPVLVIALLVWWFLIKK
ncbi:hypothetical protein C7T94_10045 [Pedobacter yulinensis]|uniref:Uncharacterized protein n=1 Tax=Pedobacter yulinensis TaxID=2126353 RepID=A0A2T3HKP3_9SPHI|nr:hypothetical protein [Pedobacter yulinensis]PST82961.1 hypothetical protein C7T94_10045 [Pedobacter yulinensis]